MRRSEFDIDSERLEKILEDGGTGIDQFIAETMKKIRSSQLAPDEKILQEIVDADCQLYWKEKVAFNERKRRQRISYWPIAEVDRMEQVSHELDKLWKQQDLFNYIHRDTCPEHRLAAIKIQLAYSQHIARRRYTLLATIQHALLQFRSPYQSLFIPSVLEKLNSINTLFEAETMLRAREFISAERENAKLLIREP